MLRRNRVLIGWLLPAIFIRIFSLFPQAVEQYYATGLYPYISRLQRILLGWIPFSIGDLLYAGAVIYLLTALFRMYRVWRNKNFNRNYLLAKLRKSVTTILIVYVLFNLLWGLNYNRLGIAQQVGISPGKYSREELAKVVEAIIYKLNALEASAHLRMPDLKRKRTLFGEAKSTYRVLSANDADFRYSFPSVKPSLYSYLGNYLGFTGYYNPFTGEAQVNTTVPLYLQPFTTCHEIGHQIGYAKESEANFASFLSSRESSDPAFQYSLYFDLYGYARRYIYLSDTALLRKLDDELHPAVKKDFRDLRAFLDRHANPVEVVVDKLYGQYLRANQQPSGRLSYNEVIGWLVAYYRKYGVI